MSLIHVIIPCYNVEKYLEQAVCSVLDQPSKDIDIILVDDGSPGETPQLCDKLAKNEPRIHVVHKENGGLSDARNAGIEYALNNLVTSEREFLGFLDGDDAWCSGVIDDEIVRHLQSDWKEDVIGFSGVLSNNPMDRYSEKLSNFETAQAKAREVMWYSHHVHLSAKLYAVHMFRKWNVRFQYKQLYTEDKIFLTQFYFLAETARFVNKTLHIYRKNQEGIMSSLRKKTAAAHYLPIVDGWIKCDVFLNKLTDRTGQTAHMGCTLAAAYLVEMVAEHLKKWGSKKEIMEILENHPHYPYVLHPERQHHTDASYNENRLLFEHPKRFTAKYRLLGAYEWMQWKLLQIPCVKKLWEKKRYPYQDIPQ